MQAEGRYSHHNFFGGARRLIVQATLGNLLAEQLEGRGIFSGVADDPFLGGSSPFLRPTWLLSAEVRQPWFRSPDNTIATREPSGLKRAPEFVPFTLMNTESCRVRRSSV